ncbi:MAG: two-component system NtrC family sensor histidine kinase PilS [Syntrophaceae bacterium]|nr:MAG: two-component system NtrC family sensor histidine kinase PilS [Syntrophaceae bacterium]
MHQNIEQDERTWQRLKLLIFSRLIILSIFLLVTFFLDTIRPVLPVSPVLLHLIYAVIIMMYFLSLVYTLLLRKEKYFRYNIYTQLIADICLISFLVYLTGSIGSNYSLLFTLVIIYSAIFLGRRGALIIASASSIAYGLVLDLEYFNIIPTLYSTGRDYSVETGDVFVRIIVHILSFYLVALLASIVVEQEKKTRSLLEERESAFNQLDLIFRSIIESVDTGVMTTTLQGRIKTFNRAAEAITGFQLKSIENHQIREVFPAFNVFFDSDTPDLIKSRKEVKITIREGAQVHLGCSFSPLKDKYGKQIGHILNFQDLTEIKRMEENLEKSKRLAFIGEMAAGLAHEMRNPLASITGSIHLLGQTARMEETDRRLMQIIMRGKDQLDNFVRDFLMLARPVPEIREPVNVNEVIEDVVENIKMSNEWTEDIKIVRTFSGQNKACANKEQIRQIIQNLMMNALQAMEGKGNLSLESKTVNLEDRKDYAAIKVTDDGCGIEEKDLKNVFEPFFTNKDKGTGLGLAIVSRIVDGYGGKIKIESQINQGTSITVWLPCN